MGRVRIAQISGHSEFAPHDRVDRLAVNAARKAFRKAFPDDKLPRRRHRLTASERQRRRTARLAQS